MNGITDFQATLIASAIIIGMVVGLLLWALVNEHGHMRRWQDRAIEAQRQAIANADTAARATTQAATFKAQRDDLIAGRSSLRSVDQSDIEHWKGGAVSWS